VINYIITLILIVREISCNTLHEVLPLFWLYRICFVNFVEGTGAIFMQSFTEQGDAFLIQLHTFRTKTLRINLILSIFEVIWLG